MSTSIPTDIIAFVGSTPEQVVVRALAACTCNGEGHDELAPQLLARVQPNEGEPSWPFVLVLPYDGDGWDLDAEGVRIYTDGMSES